MLPLYDCTGNYLLSIDYISSVGSSIWRSISFVFSLALVDICVKFAADSTTDRCFCWPRRPLAVIYDYGRYLVISFAVSPVHDAKDP